MRARWLAPFALLLAATSAARGEDEPDDRVAVAVVGRVVNERREPVAGANVRLDAGDAHVDARTDSRGRFRFDALVDPVAFETGRPWGLVATDAGGRVGAAAIHPDDTVAVHLAGTLVVEPGREVRVRAHPPNEPGATIVQAWSLQPAGPVLAATAATDDDGYAVLRGVPRGRTWIAAARPSAGHEIHVGSGRLPDLTTLPPASKPLSLDVRNVGEPRQRHVWVEVRPPWLPRRITESYPLGLFEDAALGVPAAAMEVRAVGVGAPRARAGSPWTRVPPDAERTTLEVVQPVPRRWSLLPGTAPVPADGTRLRLVPDRPREARAFPEEARVEGGQILVDAVGPEREIVWAVAPDGSAARLIVKPGGTGGVPTRFLARRRIDVALRERDGAPVVGAQVRVRSVLERPAERVPATDAEGRTSVVLHATGEVECIVAEGAPGWRSLGKVNLKAGDARIEATLPPLEDVVVRMTIDGKPGLPARYDLRCSDQEVADADEDATSGEIRFRARPEMPGMPISIQVEAWGHFPEEGFTEPGRAFDEWDFPAAYRKAEAGRPVTIALRRTGQVRLTLVPVGGFLGHPLLALEREKGGEWKREDPAGYPLGDFSEYVDGGPATRYVTLDAGRWRIRDPETGRATAPFDLPAPDLVVERTLDVGAPP